MLSSNWCNGALKKKSRTVKKALVSLSAIVIQELRQNHFFQTIYRPCGKEKQTILFLKYFAGAHYGLYYTNDKGIAAYNFGYLVQEVTLQEHFLLSNWMAVLSRGAPHQYFYLNTSGIPDFLIVKWFLKSIPNI